MTQTETSDHFNQAHGSSAARDLQVDDGKSFGLIAGSWSVGGNKILIKSVVYFNSHVRYGMVMIFHTVTRQEPMLRTRFMVSAGVFVLQVIYFCHFWTSSHLLPPVQSAPSPLSSAVLPSLVGLPSLSHRVRHFLTCRRSFLLHLTPT